MAEMEARVTMGREETRGSKELKVKKEMVLPNQVIFHCFCTCYLCPHMHLIRCILNILINITKCPFKSKGPVTIQVGGGGGGGKKVFDAKKFADSKMIVFMFFRTPLQT